MGAVLHIGMCSNGLYSGTNQCGIHCSPHGLSLQWGLMADLNAASAKIVDTLLNAESGPVVDC